MEQLLHITHNGISQYNVYAENVRKKSSIHICKQSIFKVRTSQWYNIEIMQNGN